MKTIARDHLLTATKRPAPAFAQKHAAEKIATGWGQTLVRLPGDTLELGGKVASAICHPVRSVSSAWTTIRTNPAAILKPAAMMAGMLALGVAFPRAMRVVGWAMTASMAVIPTFRFAKAQSREQLNHAADEASHQLVATGAMLAGTWAVSKLARFGLAKLREEPAGTPGAFSSERGNQASTRARRAAPGVDPDDLDFTTIRNDAAAGKAMLADVRKTVKEEMFAKHPQLTRAKFEGLLRAKDGATLRATYAQEVRRRVHFNWLEAHGVKPVKALTGKELAGMKQHLQDIDDAYDVADAVKGMNAGIKDGARDARAIATAAERRLFTERGVSERDFTRLARDLKPADLKRLRKFTDGWATGQSGRYLKEAAALGATDGVALEATLARKLAADMGFKLPQGGLDHRTLLSLMRDLESEGPRSAKAIVDAVNGAVARGETDYNRLNLLGQRAVLGQLGVQPHQLQALEAGDDALRVAFPKLTAAEARATQTRLLRDVLYVLPDTERAGAVQALTTKGGTLVDFDKTLAPWLRSRLDAQLLGNRDVARHLRTGMPTIQQSSFLTSLDRLPAAVREEVFTNLTGKPETQIAQAVDRLAALIEKRYDVRVHRTAGTFPDKGWGYEPYTHDWSVQGLVDLHNGLAGMAKGGKLPKAVRGTTFVRMIGGPEGPGATPGIINPTLPHAKLIKRPGSGAYPGGTYGEAATNMRGKDTVVLYDTALKVASSDEIAGISAGEGTIVHEIGHAIQLGGPGGKAYAVRIAAEKKAVAEWSSLSGWHEADGKVADAWYGDVRYYKDPTVRVAARREVATAYAVTDPIEDFAEYTRFFYNDATTAMRLSPEKFLYFNDFVGKPYTSAQLKALAEVTGLGATGLSKAVRGVAAKVATAGARAS